MSSISQFISETSGANGVYDVVSKSPDFLSFNSDYVVTATTASASQANINMLETVGLLATGRSFEILNQA